MSLVPQISIFSAKLYVLCPYDRYFVRKVYILCPLKYVPFLFYTPFKSRSKPVFTPNLPVFLQFNFKAFWHFIGFYPVSTLVRDLKGSAIDNRLPHIWRLNGFFSSVNFVCEIGEVFSSAEG